MTSAPARSVLEHFLVRTWEELLKTGPIGLTDDFFALGGDSLAAAELLAEVEEHSAVKIPLNEFGEHPTIEGLVASIGRYAQLRMVGPLMEFATGGTRRPLFVFDPIAVLTALTTAEMLRHVDAAYPTYLGQSVLVDHGRTASSMEQLVAEHVDAVLELAPSGPYRLAGVCSGGYVAVAVADELRRRGADVELLAVIHAGHPSAYARGWNRRMVGVLAGAVRCRLLSPRVAGELYVLLRMLREAWRSRAATARPKSLRVAFEAVAEHRFRVRTLNMGLRDWVCASYELPRWPGRIVYLAAREPAGDPRDVPDGWEQVAAELEVVRVPWRYENLYPHLPQIGVLLSRYLRELDGVSGPSAQAGPGAGDAAARIPAPAVTA